jgi:hypothetical protein
LNFTGRGFGVRGARAAMVIVKNKGANFVRALFV